MGDVYHVHLVLKSAQDSRREEVEGVEGWVRDTLEGAKVDGWVGSVGLEGRLGLVCLLG